MQTLSKTILIASAIVASAALASYGAISGDLSTTSVSYGPAYAVQTIGTGFGNAAGGDDSVNGSELDANYGTISDDGNLYLFLAGNVQNNGNHWNIFIQGAAGGQSTLNVSGGWTASAMNGSQFSPGFAPNLLIDANNYSGTLYTDTYFLNGGGSVNNYLGAIPATSTGIFPATTFSGITLALVNTNGAGVDGTTGAAESGAGVGVGLELAIPLSQLGYTGGGIEVMECVNGGGDGYMSNQFLPGLPVGTGNLGNGSPEFNFSGTPGEFYTVVPEPSSIALVVVGLLGAFGMIRRRNA
jgi:PEP-CTERM motif